ncbi:MAG: YraN family protein [Candidatus Pacebacteria bacterium]|nr:YraN family protein [Candidatus Paceibacterota bacterium]
MKRFTSQTQKIGEIGEGVAEKFLVKHGYTVIERNYTLKTGEIDIITLRSKEIGFWEVKTTQCSTRNVSRGTYNPFENIHAKKLKRFVQTVEQYLFSHNVSHETKWGIHGLAVYLDLETKEARVEVLENII